MSKQDEMMAEEAEAQADVQHWHDDSLPVVKAFEDWVLRSLEHPRFASQDLAGMTAEVVSNIIATALTSLVDATHPLARALYVAQVQDISTAVNEHIGDWITEQTQQPTVKVPNAPTSYVRN